MSTAVIYVDEAGSPGPHSVPLAAGETPVFTLAGLAFPLEDWRQRDRGFLRLKKEFFPDLMGRENRRDEETEIKGRDLTSPRQSTSSRRQAFNRRALEFIERCGGKGFAVTFLKNSVKSTRSHSIYAMALQVLVERISAYIAESERFDHAILICDSRMKGIAGSDIEVARSHMSYIFGHSTGRTLTNILEAPLFADSRLTVGLQLVDIFASNLYACHYHYHLQMDPGLLDYSHARRWWPTLDLLQFKSAGLINGYRVFGYRVIDFRTPPMLG